MKSLPGLLEELSSSFEEARQGVRKLDWPYEHQVEGSVAFVPRLGPGVGSWNRASNEEQTTEVY